MTSKQRVLLVGGTGNMGSKIASALAKKEGIELRALVRSRKAEDDNKQQQLQRLQSLGAELVEGELNDSASLESACNGVNIILSALNGWDDVVVTGQLNLLEAAKRAGVPRFMPSDFSYDYSKSKQVGGQCLQNRNIHKEISHAKNSSISYSRRCRRTQTGRFAA